MSTSTPMKKKGVADDVDKHVGFRLRAKRTVMGITQEKLASMLGITFQQVQKYEKGTNRISASRLHQLSQILEVPVNYFYQNMDAANVGLSDNKQEEFGGPETSAQDDILSKKETLDLLRVYYSIEDEKKRKDILKFVRSMADK